MLSPAESIRTRRSIRRFSKQAVEADKLNALLEAVQWSPSWANTQCWEVIVVQDRPLQDQLGGLLSKKNPATLAVTHAPVLLALCASRGKAGYYGGKALTRYDDWFMFDLGLAAQSISLAAHHLGLGSVIVGAFDHDQAGRLLELPDGVDLVALMPVGYPDHAPSAPKRRDIGEFAHQNRYGQPLK